MSPRSRTLAAAAALAVLLAAQPSPAAPDRSRPPVPGPVKPLALPPIERHALSNGVSVLIAGMHEVPVVEVVLVLKGGAAADPAGKDGLAAMTAAMLDEGAGGRDALALADEVDFLGASLDSAAAWDAATVGLRVPRARLEPALALMADVALRPDFPEAELARVRKLALTGLLQARDEPRAIAGRAIAQAVFGRGHRFGRPLAGDAAEIASFTAAELREFHRARYTPQAAALVVVGDVTAAVLPALEKAFGGWKPPAAASPLPVPPAAPQLRGRGVWLVDKKGAAQSALRVGRVGPSWPDPSYASTEVMNTLLGGSFTSRLNDNLREQHGYAYGASSQFRRQLGSGLFLVATDVQTDKTAPATQEVFRELERILLPAAAEEVERARNYAALSFASEFETTGQLAGRIVDQVVYGFPDGFYESFVPKALAADSRAVQAAARATIDPKRSVLVVVGDRARVEAPLRALGLGELRNLSVEDVMGKPPAIE